MFCEDWYEMCSRCVAFSHPSINDICFLRRIRIASDSCSGTDCPLRYNSYYFLLFGDSIFAARIARNQLRRQFRDHNMAGGSLVQCGSECVETEGDHPDRIDLQHAQRHRSGEFAAVIHVGQQGDVARDFQPKLHQRQKQQSWLTSELKFCIQLVCNLLNMPISPYVY